ncbi:MAG: FMN-binding protein [Desulfobacterales bacterium]|nr:FMN-binding protein [Desulfobacterales bacterium]
MSDRVKSLLFAVVMGMVCSLLLTAAAMGLRDRQQENMRLDRQKNLLKSVGLLDADKNLSAEAVRRLYTENIEQVRVDRAGRIGSSENARPEDLTLYLYRPKETIEGYIVPIDTRGLWGKIQGYLALKNDGATISGFTVYKHNETPGLGGEIEQGWFQKNFVGKRIVTRTGEFAAITIAKGAVGSQVPKDERSHYVDGISGATLTGRFLTAGLRSTLAAYEPVSVRFRTDHTLQTQQKGPESKDAP